MRRTVGVLLAAGTVLALAGAAGATAYARTIDRPASVGAWQAPPATPTGASGSIEAARPGPTASTAASTAGSPAGPRRAFSRAERATRQAPRLERIGTVESVRRLLGYREAADTTTLHYPGASYVKVHFDRLLLLPGDYVTVADPAGREVHRYDATPLGGLGALGGLTGLGQLGLLNTGRWAMSVTGDTAVLTLHRNRPDLLGLGATLDRLGVVVDRVARGYTDRERRYTDTDTGASGRHVAAHPEPGPDAIGTRRPAGSEGARPGREESVCGGDEKVDAVCYRSTDPVPYTRSRAVARLLINGVELCTGWRIGTGNRMLTNHHCFATSGDAYQTEVWFDYQCSVCRGREIAQPTKVWGNEVLATDRNLDFTLFTVENFNQVQKFGHLLLSARRPVAGDELYIPQHPSGAPTMIAMSGPGRAGNCAVADPEYDGYVANADVSYYCDTEGGSSGSPVLSRADNHVVALHHFGGCPNSGVRADLVYERIKTLL